MNVRSFISTTILAVALGACSVSEADNSDDSSTDALQRRWARCSVDTDCVATHGVCGRWVAVHKDHLSAAEAHYRRINMMVRCKQILEPEFPTVCEKQLCTVQRPKSAEVQP